MEITPGSTTDLLFQAPPSRPDDVDDSFEESTAPSGRSAGRASSRGGSDATAPQGGSTNLRMLKGARQAAAGMKISEAQIRSVIEDPQDVQPDPRQPHRTRLSRDGVTVTTGNDGMILRVTRKR